MSRSRFRPKRRYTRDDWWLEGRLRLQRQMARLLPDELVEGDREFEDHLDGGRDYWTWHAYERMKNRAFWQYRKGHSTGWKRRWNNKKLQEALNASHADALRTLRAIRSERISYSTRFDPTPWTFKTFDETKTLDKDKAA